MTILESLLADSIFAIPDKAIEKICIKRGLVSTDLFTLILESTKEYQLATADLLVWLHDAPSFVEQEVGQNNAIAIKQDMMDRANRIYGLYEDSKFSGQKIGFIGENWNG